MKITLETKTGERFEIIQDDTLSGVRFPMLVRLLAALDEGAQSEGLPDVFTRGLTVTKIEAVKE